MSHLDQLTIACRSVPGAEPIGPAPITPTLLRGLARDPLFEITFKLGTIVSERLQRDEPLDAIAEAISIDVATCLYAFCMTAAASRGAFDAWACPEHGGGYKPFTLVQCEIAAGVRDFDGAYTDEWAGILNPNEDLGEDPHDPHEEENPSPVTQPEAGRVPPSPRREREQDSDACGDRGGES